MWSVLWINEYYIIIHKYQMEYWVVNENIKCAEVWCTRVYTWYYIHYYI